MAVLDDRIHRRHHRVARLFANLQRNLVDGRERPRRVVVFEQLVAFAPAIAVIRALVHDEDCFPRVKADRIDDQPVVRRVRRIDGPVQPMRIAKTVRPDFLSSAGRRDKWIVVGNPIAAVLAHRARRDVLIQIRNDAKNFSHQRVEPLRVGPDRNDLRLA